MTCQPAAQCTVSELKDQLVPLVGCPRERHHIIYNGRVLHDGLVLREEGGLTTSACAASSVLQAA